jgi:hypothetical protein
MLLYLIQEGSLEIPFIIIGVGSDSVDFQNPGSIVCDHHQPEFVSPNVENHPVTREEISGVEPILDVLGCFPVRTFGFRQPRPEGSARPGVLLDELFQDLFTDYRHATWGKKASLQIGV